MLCGWDVNRALLVLRTCREDGSDPEEFIKNHARSL
jgi:hypothetical protein